MKNHLHQLTGLVIVSAGFLLLAGCVTQKPAPQPATPSITPSQILKGPPESSRNPTPLLTSTPTDIWFVLLGRTPVPWTTPLPPPRRTALDGTYGKFDPDEEMWWVYRRCPDYLPAGGNWRLHLDRGIYRIFYEVNNWRSLGSFTINGDRIYLFNDPYCQYETGIYRWKLEDRQLTFEVIEDPCSFGLRKANLTKQPWLSCQPPNKEAAISDHWIHPPGCTP